MLTFLLWSCNSHRLERPDPNPTGESAQYREINPIRNVDILFVVDNSGSMGEEQRNLAANFPTFMDELTALQGGDFHIATVSTDLGGGAGSAQAQCNRPGGDNAAFCTAQTSVPLMPQTWVTTDFCQRCGVTAPRFLRTVNPNFTGNIRYVFSCMASFGTSGCGFEQSLQSLRDALTSPDNAGFLRDDAYLAFVIITDEEDCSAPRDSQLYAGDIAGQDWSLRCYLEAVTCNGTKNDGTMNVDLPLDACQVAPQSALIPVPDLVQSVLAVKGGDPSRIIAAGIFGWPLPGQEAAARYRIGGGARRGMGEVCASQGNGSATPAYRVKSFVESFPNHSTYSICQNDFRAAMRRIGEKIRTAVGPPCVDAPLVDLDGDPNNDMVKADCSVTERRPRGDGQFDETVVPSCTAAPGAGTCWNLVANAGCTVSGHLVEVVRPPGEMPVEGTQQSIRCLTRVTDD